MPLNTKMIFSGPVYSSLDQDEGLPLGTPSKTKNPHRFPKLYDFKTVLGAALSGAAAAIVVTVLVFFFWDGRTAWPTKNFTPGLPYSTAQVFNQDDRFVNGIGTASWKKTWFDKMQPADGGFIAIPNPHQYGLSGGFPRPNTTVPTESYVLSIFHQLHCLMALRQDTHDLLNQTLYHPANINMTHNNHCYEYIRQAILCAGDMTLEPAEVQNGERIHSVDGWGVTHQCRDFEKILEFAERSEPDSEHKSKPRCELSSEPSSKPSNEPGRELSSEPTTKSRIEPRSKALSEPRSKSRIQV
ncbi:hypothetical protein PRZ48_008889 [Zasmidium cellare]|uniref:Tat pathway signal sequence n=1 Tax=Zasmidium cellare TaxID=395010 RepID=A0ABR0EHS0_ZASCE|nr:hypothetical protein PRZ48_008889 [Zasmidium cellare]